MHECGNLILHKGEARGLHAGTATGRGGLNEEAEYKGPCQGHFANKICANS